MYLAPGCKMEEVADGLPLSCIEIPRVRYANAITTTQNNPVAMADKVTPAVTMVELDLVDSVKGVVGEAAVQGN